MVSFIVPVRDDAERLSNCLRRIAESAPEGAGVEVIVADNGSTDRSAEAGREAGATVVVWPGLGVSELRNRAAAEASGDILAFVDADNEIAPGWIAAAIDGLSMSRVGAIGAPYHAPSPGTWVQRFYDGLRRHPTDLEIVEWLGSGNMAVRRAAFEAVGGFDTTLETCEDVDLCRKLRQRGFVLIADRRMKNVHHGDPTTLREVFFGELWRGRDNLRVSLRRPLSARTLVSAAMPVANLAAAGVVVAGLAVGSPLGRTAAAVALIGLWGAVGLRASRILPSGEPRDWPRAFAVAAAYEAGRAIAVAGRFGHGRRRPAQVA
jgi:GT2 family glycosyltransferase